MGAGIFNVSVLAVISVLAAVADIFIRRKMGLH